MPCFYCGKNVPVFRRLTDPDFCSDEHRQLYHELTKKALHRLLEASPTRKTKPPSAPTQPTAPPPAPPLSAGPMQPRDWPAHPLGFHVVEPHLSPQGPPSGQARQRSLLTSTVGLTLTPAQPLVQAKVCTWVFHPSGPMLAQTAAQPRLVVWESPPARFARPAAAVPLQTSASWRTAGPKRAAAVAVQVPAAHLAPQIKLELKPGGLSVSRLSEAAATIRALPAEARRLSPAAPLNFLIPEPRCEILRSGPAGTSFLPAASAVRPPAPRPRGDATTAAQMVVAKDTVPATVRSLAGPLPFQPCTAAAPVLTLGTVATGLVAVDVLIARSAYPGLCRGVAEAAPSGWLVPAAAPRIQLGSEAPRAYRLGLFEPLALPILAAVGIGEAATPAAMKLASLKVAAPTTSPMWVSGLASGDFRRLPCEPKPPGPAEVLGVQLRRLGHLSLPGSLTPLSTRTNALTHAAAASLAPPVAAIAPAQARALEWQGMLRPTSPLTVTVGVLPSAMTLAAAQPSVPQLNPIPAAGRVTALASLVSIPEALPQRRPAPTPAVSAPPPLLAPRALAPPDPRGLPAVARSAGSIPTASAMSAVRTEAAGSVCGLKPTGALSERTAPALGTASPVAPGTVHRPVSAVVEIRPRPTIATFGLGLCAPLRWPPRAATREAHFQARAVLIEPSDGVRVPEHRFGLVLAGAPVCGPQLARIAVASGSVPTENLAGWAIPQRLSLPVWTSRLTAVGKPRQATGLRQLPGRPAQGISPAVQLAAGPAAPALALPERRPRIAVTTGFPMFALRPVASRPQTGAMAFQNKPVGDPRWRTRGGSPHGLVAPVHFRFELPPPTPIWTPLLEFWRAVPAVVRNGLAVLAGFALLAFLFWIAAGEAVGEQLARRAAIEIAEDFRGGLGGWMGAKDWAHTWARDPSGYVQVGQLALLRRSRNLSDYEVEFLGQITHKSLGWVYRAVDLENYYAMQLTVLKPGPLPVVSLVRQVVVQAKPQQRVQIPVRVVIHDRTPVRIKFQAKGDGFTTWLNGQIVDFWRDDRFSSGAVGLFGEPEDRPQVYWIRVSHQNDFLGKLCAYLAPSHREVPNP